MINSFNDAIGKTLSIIKINNQEDSVEFIFNDGYSIKLIHHQDCCESVYLKDICGDIDDLIGTPLIMAEESTSDDIEGDDHDSYSMWTFYRFATKKGQVDFSWFGTSNGYYSVSVSCEIYFSEKNLEKVNKKLNETILNEVNDELIKAPINPKRKF